MGSKFEGSFEASGRVGLRDGKTRDLVAVYPYKVQGNNADVTQAVKSWFYEETGNVEKNTGNYFVDVLSPTELKNSQEIFLD